MRSFAVTAVANLARDPELKSKDNITYTRFCPLGTDYAGIDGYGMKRSHERDVVSACAITRSRRLYSPDAGFACTSSRAGAGKEVW